MYGRTYHLLDVSISICWARWQPFLEISDFMHCTYCTRLTLDTVVALRFASRLQALRKTKTTASVSTLGLLGRRLGKQSFKSAKHRAVPTCYIILYSKANAKQYHIDFARSPRQKDRDNNREPHTQLQFVHFIFHIGSIVQRYNRLVFSFLRITFCVQATEQPAPMPHTVRGSSFGELWPLGPFSCWVHTPGSRWYVFWKAWKDRIRG